jgi:hypothetical protein
LLGQIDVQIKGVETSRTSDAVDENTEVSFNVGSSITESDRGPGFVNLKFSIDLETQPSAARIFVSGTASVSGKDEEIDEILGAKERDGTPTLFMRIYQRVYPTMYLLCGSLHIPYPGPGLLRQNKVETEAQGVPTPSVRTAQLGITR